MAEDPEKRIQIMMKKLCRTHKPNSPFPSLSTAQYQKHKYAASEDKIDENPNAVQPPPRPWSRADLMRRLATFKSMKWFAKPKSVDAVSCSRRGWVNVDVDIIACEVCGARLQFITPATWHQRQVEKAALVFSLKLDTGHKLLCPWTDNACDESLALFPPKPVSVLVDEYKQRSSALLQLSALPLISGSAIKSMRNPHLEHFLKQSTVVECGTGPNDSIWPDSFRTDMEAVSGDLYYQAHRLLSLCGWEPRLLPYMVDCGDAHILSGSNNDLIGSSDGDSVEQNSNLLCVYVSGSDKRMKNDEHPGVLSTYHDPSSIVLDCKFCGASVGLWAFTTVPRPLEMVRVVGNTEIGGGNGKSDLSATNNANASQPVPTSNLTIAGGPPPAKQNFKATISLPVIGRSVKARLSDLSSEVRNTGQEGVESPSMLMQGSTENNWNEGSRDPQEIVGTSNANAIQTEPPSTPGDGTTNDQLMHTDITTSEKETSSVPTNEQNDNEVRDNTDTSSHKDVTSAAIDKDRKRHSADRMMEFHPIRQHRHFCPWGAATETTAPGWLQTLSALQKEKVFSLPDNEGSPSTPSVIRVDDPITSIKKLFESPPAKRVKLALPNTGK